MPYHVYCLVGNQCGLSYVDFILELVLKMLIGNL